MILKIHRILIGSCLIALGLTTPLFSQSAEKYYLRLTPFKSSKDSLSLEIELRFWQEFREQVEKSETVKIVSGWDEIVDLLEYAEEITRTPAIFDTSKIQNPAMIAPNLHVRGTIRKLRQQEIELDIQIVRIRAGEQIATEYARIPISTDPFKDASTPAIRQLILKLMEPLDPKIKKQKSWLGEPFDPEKINILVADFTNFEGNVDAPGKQWAWKTFNELDQFMKADPGLREVVEVKRLYSDSIGIVIREETRAKEVGEAMNADMIIWGQNLCVRDSICYYAKAFITHEARVASTIERGVIHQTQLLRADLPMLIGAKANVLVKFIIGWTYLEDYRHQQFRRAVNYLQQALSETSADERKNILRWAGNAASFAGEYEPALIWNTELEKHQIESDDRAGLATTYNNIGLIYSKKGERDKALEYYGKSEKIRLEVGDRAGLASTYNNIGAIYDKRGEWDKALEFYNKSKEIFLEVRGRVGLASTYNNIGAIYDKKGEWDKALEFYGKSKEIFLEVGDRASLAGTYNNIGAIYDKKGEWDKALEFYGKSKEIFLEVGDRAGLATAYNNIGRIYDNKGEWDKALEYFDKSEKIFIEVGGSANLAIIYNNIGSIYSKKGEWNKALEYYSKSEKICLEVEGSASLAIIYYNIGSIYSQKGEWDKALEYYGKSEKICLELRYRVVLAQVQNSIGVAYIKQSKDDSALPYLHAALQAFQQMGDQKMMGSVYNNLGSAHKVRQAWPEALMWLRKSVAHNRAAAGDSASILGFTYYHLAEVFLHTHQPDSARYYVEKSLLLRQALGEAENVKQTRELRERILSAAPKSSKK